MGVIADDIFDALDIQTAMNTIVLPGDPDFGPMFANILDDDPGTVTAVVDHVCAFTLIGEGDESATLGNHRRRTLVSTFAAVIYVSDPNRSSASKRKIVKMTRTLREAISRNPVDKTPGDETLWYMVKFRRNATTYHATANFRHSVTLVDYYTQVRT